MLYVAIVDYLYERILKHHVQQRKFYCVSKSYTRVKQLFFYYKITFPRIQELVCICRYALDIAILYLGSCVNLFSGLIDPSLVGVP